MEDAQSARAVDLIQYSPETGFQVGEEAAALLESLDETVAVVAVAGKYRTGKSYLLNRIILNEKSKGFGVGPTINPCTKGLQIWSEPLDAATADGKPIKVLVIDSEGMGSVSEDTNHDTRIFLLALLLSSHFVYNSVGTIDENAIQQLSLIVNLSKQLYIRETQSLGQIDPEEIAQYFPSFLWVVRDFALKIESKDGAIKKSKEYLEDALEARKGNSESVEQKNRVRNMIRTCFSDRDCLTLVRPTESEEALQTLESLPDEELRPDFVRGMSSLRNKIFNRVKPKMMKGQALTGSAILKLCQSYSEAINTGKVPCIESSWKYVVQFESEKQIKKLMESYQKDLATLVESGPPVGSEQSMTSYLALENERVIEDLFNKFKKNAMGD